MAKGKAKIGRLVARSLRATWRIGQYFAGPAQRADGWRWIVDNSMRAYGEVDPNERIVRINVARHRRYDESLIDTLVHEQLHIMFPRLGEDMICRMTDHWLELMSKSEKARLYAKVRQRKGRRRAQGGVRRDDGGLPG